MKGWLCVAPVVTVLVLTGAFLSLAGCGSTQPVITTLTTANLAGQAAAQAAQEDTGYRAALEDWVKTYFDPIDVGALYVHREQAKTPQDYIALARAYEVQVRTAWLALKQFTPPASITQKHVQLVEAFGDEVKILGYLIDAVQSGDQASFLALVDAQWAADQRLQEAEAALSPYLENQASPSM
jgi:hypothetical protein